MTRRLPCLLAALLLALPHSGAGQQIDLKQLFEERNLGPVAHLLETGDYEFCARICEAAVERGLESPEWRRLRVRALMELGREEEARDAVQLAIKTFPGDLELLLLQHDNALRFGRRDLADQALRDIDAAARAKPAKTRSASDWVVLGKAALALGADPRKVIAQYYQVAQKQDAKHEAAWLAEGELALAKHDAQRASEVFRAGLKAHGESTALRMGLARAFAGSDSEKTAENLNRVLEVNPMHAGALLLRAEHLIRAEKYLDAEGAIQKVLDLRDNHPEAWALRAAIARLNSADEAKFTRARDAGLKRWNQNPLVDHVIGRVLSRAYRFAEGAEHQRRALAFDRGFLPARVQLCHDLLRLGEEDEAWKLAAAIRAEDAFDIQAHNIGRLEARMREFVSQRAGDFILKMPPHDWPVYGPRALELLREARDQLGTKYGLEQKRPVLVEFFDSQQDFAIRTFGSLGGQGLLGVCFGTVITMNSPGSLAHGRNNWEATLWHEYCHVVTLTLTQNKMPRWLSEGISVHEEGLRNRAWGMRMNADFRRLILEEDAALPISQLSAAFLNPPSPEHLSFAYYQSSLVVDYLVERFGQEALRGVLADLAAGRRVNEAITARTEPMENLEKDFDQHLKKLARAFGAEADWSRPQPEEVNPLDANSLTAYRDKHPDNLWALRLALSNHLDGQRWEQALTLAERLTQLVPDDFSAEGGHAFQARILGKLGRDDERLKVLRRIAEGEPSAMAVFQELIDHDSATGDWTAVSLHAARALALNPFLPAPQRALAEAAEATGDTATAVAARERLLRLDPGNAARHHYRLALLLRPGDPVRGKRHLLESLALAPRFREGLAQLNEWP
jgi:tetratricopeptide (TPR) repeat protein